jgi:hypothetical protein
LPSKINTIGSYKYNANILRNVISNVDAEISVRHDIIQHSGGFTLASGLNSTIESISIYSNLGKLYLSSSDVETEFKVNNLPTGLYHLYIIHKDGSYSIENILIFE